MKVGCNDSTAHINSSNYFNEATILSTISVSSLFWISWISFSNQPNASSPFLLFRLLLKELCLSVATHCSNPLTCSSNFPVIYYWKYMPGCFQAKTDTWHIADHKCRFSSGNFHFVFFFKLMPVEGPGFSLSFSGSQISQVWTVDLKGECLRNSSLNSIVCSGIGMSFSSIKKGLLIFNIYFIKH